MDIKDIEMMLPEYVNGRLSSENTAWIEQVMQDDINIKTEVEFLQHMREVIKNEVVESPAEWGLARLKRSLPIGNEMPVQNASSWWKHVAVAASFAFILQTSYMLFNESVIDDSYVPLATSELENTIQIVFDSNVTEARLRKILIRVEATIVSGPSGSGVYRIVAKDHKSAIALLKENKWVEHVEKE